MYFRPKAYSVSSSFEKACPGDLINISRSRSVIAVEWCYVIGMIGVKNSIKLCDIQRKLFLFGLNIEKIKSLEGKNRLYISMFLFRKDLMCNADFLEEVLKVIGLEKVDKKNVYKGIVTKKHASLNYDQTIRMILCAFGFFEVINYSFDAPGNAVFFNGYCIKLQNPLGETMSVLRQSLLPGLISNFQFNKEHGRFNVSLFEFGFVFARKRYDVLVVTRKLLLHDLYRDSCVQEFKLLSGITEDRVESLKEKIISFYCGPLALIEFFPIGKIQLGRIIGEEMYVYKMYLGFVGNGWFGGKEVGCFELFLDVLKKHDHFVSCRMVNRYPNIQRDLSVVFFNSIFVSEIGRMLQWIKKINYMIESINLFDVFVIMTGDGGRSLSFSFVFRGKKRTLHDVEVVKCLEVIQYALIKKAYGKLREVK